MNDAEGREIVALLREIRDDQRQMLARQAEQIELVRTQAERATRIQDRSEQIQDRSAHLMKASRRALMILLPIVVALIAYVSWLIFRLAAR